VSPDQTYPPGNSVLLEPGDIVVLATDGAIEQHNSSGEMFGVQRLQDVIARNFELPAAALVECVRSALCEFLTGVHFSDDVTLLILKREIRSGKLPPRSRNGTQNINPTREF